MVQIINDVQLDFSDVLIVPQATTINHRGEVDIIRDFKKLGFKATPIMNANMTQTGTFNVAKKLVSNNMIGSFHKFYTAEEIANFFTKNGDDKRYFVTIGLRNQDEEIEKLKALKDFDFSVLIDVPNAYIPAVEDLVKLVRKTCPERIIAVGNVCTGERTQELIKAGANIIKTGVGPSAVCKTRFTAGNGRPQLSTILDCANAAHQVGGYIIADGGFKYTADFNKAFVAGADFCMSGSFFAGCDEAAGEVIEKLYRTDEYDYNINEDTNEVFPLKPKYELKKFKEYYGMSSFRAQKENYGKITDSGTSEGVESKLIPYTGSIEKTIKDIQGSLRSCGSYIGSTNIKNFPRQGSFYRVNRQQ